MFFVSIKKIKFLIRNVRLYVVKNIMKCGRIYGLLPQIGCKGTNISLIYKMLGYIFSEKIINRMYRKCYVGALKTSRLCTENSTACVL